MASGKNKKTEKKGGNIQRGSGPLAVNLISMNFWRELAGHVIPDETDEVKIGEIALALQQTCQAITSEHEFIDKICDKNPDTKIKFAVAVTIDRRTNPSEVAVALGYSEKHGVTFKSQVPDPNQDELPLQSKDKGADTSLPPAGGEEDKETD